MRDKAQQRLQERRNPLDPNHPMALNTSNILNRVKLGIDFTKLAELALKNQKHQLSSFLIVYENQIVKRIPFYVQSGNYLKALDVAIMSGDPNYINNVFSAIQRRELDSYEELIEIASQVNDGMRHLRNYAKKRGVKGIPLLKEIYKVQKRSLLPAES
mmetsp:Transcript_30106/g.39968  ORF Transcript_30106/g.39968 Transcript_30106/m.39968 type:complete len:158 (+) Transcript_30106:1496-1969(+)